MDDLLKEHLGGLQVEKDAAAQRNKDVEAQSVKLEKLAVDVAKLAEVDYIPSSFYRVTPKEIADNPKMDRLDGFVQKAKVATTEAGLVSFTVALTPEALAWANNENRDIDEFKPQEPQ